jgi:hypothetical protein
MRNHCGIRARDWRSVVVWCVVIWCVVIGASAGCRNPPTDAGFWFEPVTFDSARLGGRLTADELVTIKTTAMSELTSAFKGLDLRFSERPSARYHVRVVQELHHPSFLRPVGSAGQSRVVDGFGGSGAVSFLFLASGAVAYAPADADRAAIVAAIGRGIGRTAVHELTHQLLPRAPIHDSTNPRSYEYASAARREQYYGAMEWDLAWPLLERRLGRATSAATIPAAK